MVMSARRVVRVAGQPGPWLEACGLAPGVSFGHRRWRVAVIIVAVLACVAALGVAALAGVPGPNTSSLASRPGVPSRVVRLPVGLAAAASARVGASDRRFWPVRRGGGWVSRGGSLHGAFDASGAVVGVGRGRVAFSLAGVGRGGRVDRVAGVIPVRAANRVVYRHASITEFYGNGPYGLEQGFTVPTRPRAGSGPLVVGLGIGGSLVAQQVGAQVLFRTRSGVTVMRYGELGAVDAAGRRLRARMQLRHGALVLVIDDREARYPVRIDPFIQQGAKLMGIGGAFQGVSVALSGDGNTALIGVPLDGGPSIPSGAWVFVRSGTTRTQQGAKLVGSGATVGAHQGFSVALSGDGNTALIGGPQDGRSRNGAVGAAWVFTRSGTAWTQQGAKLVGTGGAFSPAQQGFSVALSGNGHTALIGGPLTASVRGRRGSSTARAGPGPSRAQSWSAPARSRAPAASSSRAPAWRCRSTGTGR